MVWSPESLKVGHFSEKLKSVKKSTNLATGKNLIFDKIFSKCSHAKTKKDIHMKPMPNKPLYTKFSKWHVLYEQSCESIATHVSESLGHTYTRGGGVLGYDEDRHSSSGEKVKIRPGHSFDALKPFFGRLTSLAFCYLFLLAFCYLFFSPYPGQKRKLK